VGKVKYQIVGNINQIAGNEKIPDSGKCKPDSGK
jgi:hypothetical protein